MYNFEVADWHTYYVGNIGVLVHNDCNFANEKLADGHYKKHGKEFEANSKEEYLKMASNFVESKNPDILTRVCSDGKTYRYNPNTNELCAISKDNVLKTYFKPDPSVHKYPTNMDYFNSSNCNY